MKRIILAILLITGAVQADNCSDYKKKAQKYERMGMAESNLDIGAKYLAMAIKYKKETLNACFFSAFDKPKIREEIKDMDEMRRSMLAEAARKRKHDLDVARELSRGNN